MSLKTAQAGEARPAAPPHQAGGTLFYIVGASGVGKDSLIVTLRSRLPAHRFVFARRTITRPETSVGEAHDACTEDAFAERAARGGFLLWWAAHGLHYGLPVALADQLAAGRHVIANGSRGKAAELAQRVPRLVVIEIEAPPELIAARLASRGRESGDDIARRLTRASTAYPDTVEVVRVTNDSDLHTGAIRLIQAIVSKLEDDTAGARRGPDARIAPAGRLESAPQQSAGAILRRKLAGERLAQAEWNTLLQAVVEGSIKGAELDTMLIACANDLDDEELACVARWRCGLMPRESWGREPVVDKHSLGGTAGSRVTMIVVPIVAAHGMLIPKTSSRAITSAAGTADAMEVLARVDLNPSDLRRVVEQAGGCIAWNGRLNHSVLDESMHRLERLLALDTRRWSVASILSKKWSAGATHVVVDVPYMPGGKVASLHEAQAVAAMFDSLGTRLGMTVRAYPSDGAAPIGRGIGPALEVRDVLQVLEGDPRAPADLRDKALLFAARILALDPTIGDLAQGLPRWRERWRLVPQ
ncbi:MAG: phosphonate metabolism protein/1,5-bisphosphokinase (PRPP-forming) PhnN [Betaproteobacteria bacterium]